MTSDRRGPVAERTEAKIRRSRWPGWIWAVPIAALGIVTWLAVRHFVQQGTTVTVSFASAEGINAGDTKVEYRGVKVGKVEKISFGPHRQKVIATLRIKSDVAELLRKGTRFWIVGGKFNLAHLSALKTVISGPYVEMDPGAGKRVSHFEGLETPPAIQNGEAGTQFIVHARRLGSIGTGTPVYYRNLKVGAVTGYNEVSGGAQGFDFDVFVRRPYDSLVNQQTRFWDASAMRVGIGNGGIEAKMVSLATLTQGGIGFGTPPAVGPGARSKPSARFRLYRDRDAAEAAPIGPTVAYLVRFEGPVGALHAGAPVKLLGFRVGQVTHVRLHYDSQTGTLNTPVTIELEPLRLRLKRAGKSGSHGATELMNRALSNLVTHGLRAKLEKNPPFVGATMVALEFEPDASPAKLTMDRALPEIPAARSDGLATLATRASAVVTKIERLPIGTIGRDMRAAAQHLRRLVSSPKLSESLNHLERTLANLDQETAAMKGKLSPLVVTLRKTAYEARQAVASANAVLGGRGRRQEANLPAALRALSDAARSIRALADYIDRHPEALLSGRGGG